MTNLTLAEIVKQAEEIAGQWNGDDAGIQEEKARIATEIIARVEGLKLLINELYAGY
jgi:hypothetical protein